FDPKTFRILASLFDVATRQRNYARVVRPGKSRHQSLNGVQSKSDNPVSNHVTNIIRLRPMRRPEEICLESRFLVHNLLTEHETHFQDLLEASALHYPHPLARLQCPRRLENDSSTRSFRTIHVETSHAVLFRDPL